MLRARVSKAVAGLKEKAITPGLAVVFAGDDLASHIYVSAQHAAAVEVGTSSYEYRLDAATSQANLLALIASTPIRRHGIPFNCCRRRILIPFR